MLADARRSAIVAAVQRERIVRVSDLAEMFGVSLMTVRRDIDVLDEAGLVEKIHGGAKIPAAPAPMSPASSSNPPRLQEEKNAIAEEAARWRRRAWRWAQRRHHHMGAGQAAMPAEGPRITVVTNSVRIADVFHASARHSPP